jgi:predicted nucleic acid-binding protein
MNSVFIVTKESVQHIHPLIASWDLGKGESEVLSLAMQKGTNVTAVLDDLQARKCAKLLDIGLIGSVGLLTMAKRVGLVKAVKPEINKLIDVGIRIDYRLLAEIYSKTGE